MTLNPSRNTLPLANHTKNIDLEHHTNTQYSLATQHHKYSRFWKDYTWSQYNLNWIQLQSYSTLSWKSKLDVNLEILKSNLSNWISQNCFLHFWKHKQTIYIFQRLVKAINEGAYLVRKHLKQIHHSKLNFVRIFKETIGWNHETNDCFGLTVKSTKPKQFSTFFKTPKSKTSVWFDKTIGCFSLSWKNTWFQKGFKSHQF